MWSELWGTMIWGGVALPVPLLGGAGIAALAAGVLLVLRRRRLALLAGTSLALFPAVVSLAVPNSFTNGTVADANEVNANFDSVEALHDRFDLVKGFSAFSTTQTAGFVAVTGRTLTYDKQSATSDLFVTYADVLDMGVPVGGGFTLCNWRLVVDGAPTDTQFSAVNQGSFGGITVPGSFEWHVPSVAAGVHTLAIEVQTLSVQGDCGAEGGTGAFLLAEEKGR